MTSQKPFLILGIESSCDDTSVAIVNEKLQVLAMNSAHQNQKHAPFGGIVPEIASRNHLYHLLPLLQKTLHERNLQWSQIQALAVTSRPGLIGSLLVGVLTAKSIALAKKLPLIGINHLEGHLLSPLLASLHSSENKKLHFPLAGLVVSGGHSSLYSLQDFGKYQRLGHSLDDAAGEAFDKFAKMLGLGFPGGIEVDRLAKGGDPHRFAFPRAFIQTQKLPQWQQGSPPPNLYNMSFSGLKTAARHFLEKISEGEKEREKPHLCASFQESICDVLIYKLEKAVEKLQCQQCILAGGVSANSRLRERAKVWSRKKGIELLLPTKAYCTDNGAMIALAGLFRWQKRIFDNPETLVASPFSLEGDFC